MSSKHQFKIGRIQCLVLALFLTEGFAAIATAQDQPKTLNQETFLAGFQATFIEQYLPGFSSKYQGANSLQATPQGRLSDTYTAYLGYRASRVIELYVDPEMARGGGIGYALGLAGFTNGDVIRNPTLGQSPYWARYFARFTIATGQGEESVEKGENQIQGVRPTHRVVISAGKLGVNDIFDLNGYANSTRTQFMNWALLNDPAYDYAADTRGYSIGAAAEWIQPTWAFRIGSFQMPEVANGINLDSQINDARADQAELEIHRKMIGTQVGIARLLAYRNLADMGDYNQAIAKADGGVPDVTSTRQRGRSKYGLGLNVEQPLADDGKTGLFTRAGWNNGTTESFAYTECDNHFSVGGQIAGSHWKSPSDSLGLALVSDGLCASHARYLADGGLGFLLGDGKLNYGRENVMETYYQRMFGKYVSAALDFQWIDHPGYNCDRGPVPVLSARLHVEF